MSMPSAEIAPSRRRLATRERLRAAAAPIFAQEGIAAASVDAVCAAAGFSRGAFYSNYSTKFDLALELLAEGQRAELHFWSETARQAVDFEAALRLMEARFNRVAMRTGWGLMIVELQLEAERDPAFGGRYRRYLETLYMQSEVMVVTLCAAAGVPPPADVHRTTIAIRCFTMGLLLYSRGSAPVQHLDSPGAMMIAFMRTTMGLPG
ncbi:MAG: TetR/AcrR family transcriptional regulator [Sphingobium sp.]